MAEFILSAFSDEAGGGIIEQIAALKRNGLTHTEPRGLDYGNISEYTAEQCKELKKILDDNGIGVSAIGSPFGKINIEDDFEPHFELFKRNVENACILGTDKIRMFSFFFNENQKPEDFRDEVFERLEKFADYSLKSGVWCCHENEKDIYGDIAERCLDIYKTFKGKIKGVFDSANFIQCGVQILPAYEMLEEYIEYMHVKDCLFETGKVVPAGKGDGEIVELLKRFSKKDGKRILTLEPHLTVFEGLAALEGEGGTADQLKDDFTYASQTESFDAASNALHEVLSQI
ncbi:MAG: sugar phosphate isomerase/epimerase [Clostridia bacterium]|nr:sugar phosphate isomerase/epimerase [Clostridia bacterium]